MKKKLPREGVIVMVGLIAFVAISFALNLISDALLPDVTSSPQQQAPAASEPADGQEPNQSIGAVAEQEPAPVPNVRSETQDSPEAAEPTTEPYSNSALVDNPAVTYEISEVSIQEDSEGMVKALTDYSLAYTASEIVPSGNGLAQSISYVVGESLCTDILLEIPGGRTLHYTVNRTQSEAAYQELVTMLSEEGTSVPSAPDLAVEHTTPQPSESGSVSQQQSPQGTEHDAPVIVR